MRDWSNELQYLANILYLIINFEWVPGSIGEDYLVTWDNLTVEEGKYEHFVEKFNMNTGEQIESLKNLPEPGSFSYILTGHNGVIKLK